MRQVFAKMYMSMCVLFLVWFVISYLDIVAHNLTTQQYLTFNIFRFIM